jgi:hypothetical protein
VAQLSDEQLPLHQDRIQDYCSTVKTDVDFIATLEPGAACMALCEDVWYRARITQIQEDGINVLFVDYGNSEVVRRDNLRRVCKELMELPVQAFHCKLSGIQPLTGEEWDEASCNRFQELVLLEEAKSFQLRAPKLVKDEDGVKFVEGHLVDGEADVADLLVDGGYAQSSCDITETPAETVLETATEAPLSQRNPYDSETDLEKEVQRMVADVIKLAQDELVIGNNSDAEVVADVEINDAVDETCEFPKRETGAESNGAGDVKDDFENSHFDEPTKESQEEHGKSVANPKSLWHWFVAGGSPDLRLWRIVFCSLFNHFVRTCLHDPDPCY